jgi:hypothetical protein
MKISSPPSRKKMTISSDGTTPRKMYDRINRRRTRQSSCRFVSRNSRHANTDTEITSPIVAALLKIEMSGESSTKRRNSATTSLSAAEIMKRRPAQVPSSRSRVERCSSGAGGSAGRPLPGSHRSGPRGVLIPLVSDDSRAAHVPDRARRRQR